MRVKGIIEEDFVNYKLPSMFITTCSCDFKCCTESGLDIGVCQNASLAQASDREISDTVIYQHFAFNPISKAVVIGGMEPFLQFDEIVTLLQLFRNNGDQSDFVIYTGYYPEEIQNQIRALQCFDNVIVKFGRFIPNRPHKYDPVLGVELSSDNQFAEKLS